MPARPIRQEQIQEVGGLRVDRSAIWQWSRKEGTTGRIRSTRPPISKSGQAQQPVNWVLTVRTDFVRE